MRKENQQFFNRKIISVYHIALKKSLFYIQIFFFQKILQNN